MAAEEETKGEAIEDAFVYCKFAFPKLDKDTKKALKPFVKEGWGRQLRGMTIAFRFKTLSSLGSKLNVGQKVGLRLVAVREDDKVCAFRVELIDETTDIGFGPGKVSINDFLHVTICCAPLPEGEDGKFYPPSLARDLSAESETLLEESIEIETVVTVFFTERRVAVTADHPLVVELNAALSDAAVVTTTEGMAAIDMSA